MLINFSIYAQQQKISIQGKVFDESSKSAAIGINVTAKEQQGGQLSSALTDISGSFSIAVKSLPVTLKVTSMGYKEQEIDIYEYTDPLTIYLTQDLNLLNSVVVVGYGTQKRKELTGAIATVPSSFLSQSTVSFDNALGGAVAGVNVTQSSGQPGSAASIRIRGGNSVYAKNDPLYVIDGFIFYSDNSSTKAGLNGIEGNLNPLASINPKDIESIEVLKDVSATAIYGSRGANGVIIVTTKKGKKGGNSINYQYTTGWSKSVKKLDLLNATQWARIQKDYFNSNKYTDAEIAQLGQGYNWQDAVLETGLTQTHELSLSGGDKTRYLLSGSYSDQNGIVLNSGFERYSGRVNLDRDLSSDFSVGIAVTADKSTQNSLTTFEDVNYNDSPYSHGITNSLTYALYMPPVVPIYNADGSYNYTNSYEHDYLTYYGKSANPVSDLKNSIGQTIKTSLLGSFYAKYTILEGLVAKFNTGTNVNYVTQNFYAPSYTALGLEKQGIGGIGNKNTTVSQMEYTLNYSKKINSANYLEVLAGYTHQTTKTNYAINLTSHLLTFKNLAAGSNPYPPSSNASESDIHSLLSRVNYTLLDRYNFTVTMRGDKSSRFSQGNRWGYFPSFGFSWNVNKEGFFKKLPRALSSLKLRATYGTVGNTEIGDYEYSQLFSASIYNGQVAYTLTNLGNDNLKWETTAQYNAGIDAGFLNDRFTLVADIYYKKTSDLLLKVPVSSWSGTSESQLVNVGDVTNKGIELAVTANLVDRKRFTWTASANIARNINKITSMGTYNELTSGKNQEEILRVGESLGSFYGLIFNGVVQKNEDVSKLPTVDGNTPQPGDSKFVDVNGDNKIDKDDRKVLGNVQPAFTYGLSSTFTYHGFDVFISLQGSKGNKVYNLLRRYLERPNDSYNLSAALLSSWTEENPSGNIPKIGSPVNSYLDSRYVEDASYLKLKTITLGYTLPVRTPKLSLKLRFFASVQNVLTFTKYKGYDPEVASGKDLGIYPSSRNYQLGVGVNF
ncbi:MAG: TonB-dependent receptor [Bacteroidota bacterium]|nr:TonB-dependent receptor [Bacteroidota bacterium]